MVFTQKKQLILFSFLPANDYNLKTIKLSLFLLSFALYFTVNAFFFTDSSMKKITENNGKYNLLLQIPQITYSIIILILIRAILKQLSLSEKDFLQVKKQDTYEDAKKYSLQIESCFKKKFIIFFILSTLFMLFFWYFISSFCAVYVNTQKILITDTLISFGLSMLYPFGLYLLPGIFRIPALKTPKKNMNCLYSLSKLFSYF